MRLPEEAVVRENAMVWREETPVRQRGIAGIALASCRRWRPPRGSRGRHGAIQVPVHRGRGAVQHSDRPHPGEPGLNLG